MGCKGEGGAKERRRGSALCNRTGPGRLALLRNTQQLPARHAALPVTHSVPPCTRPQSRQRRTQPSGPLRRHPGRRHRAPAPQSCMEGGQAATHTSPASSLKYTCTQGDDVRLQLFKDVKQMTSCRKWGSDCRGDAAPPQCTAQPALPPCYSGAMGLQRRDTRLRLITMGSCVHLAPQTFHPQMAANSFPKPVAASTCGSSHWEKLCACRWPWQPLLKPLFKPSNSIQLSD